MTSDVLLSQGMVLILDSIPKNALSFSTALALLISMISKFCFPLKISFTFGTPMEEVHLSAATFGSREENARIAE